MVNENEPDWMKRVREFLRETYGDAADSMSIGPPGKLDHDLIDDLIFQSRITQPWRWCKACGSELGGHPPDLDYDPDRDHTHPDVLREYYTRCFLWCPECDKPGWTDEDASALVIGIYGVANVVGRRHKRNP